MQSEILEILKTLADYAGLLLAAVSIIGTWLIWWHSRSKASKDEIANSVNLVKTELSGQINLVADVTNVHGNRLTKLETSLEHMPKHEDMEKLHDRISEVKNNTAKIATDVSAVTASVKAIARNVDLLNQHKMSGGGDD